MSDLVERLRDRKRLCLEGVRPLVQACEDAADAITRLRAALTEAERERDRLRSYDGDDTPFEAVHAQIRDGVLRAAEEKAARQILAIAAQRAAGRLNSELKELWDVRARAERAEADLAAAREVIGFCATFKITDSSSAEVAEDSIHEIRKKARAFLKRTATDAAAKLEAASIVP